MSDQKTAIPATQTILTCGLRHKQLQRGGSSAAGEIELQNSSPCFLAIETDRHPLQYLHLVVTDARGDVLSEGHYGDLFSPPEGRWRPFDWHRVRNTNTSFRCSEPFPRRSGYRGRTRSRPCTNTRG